MTATTTQPPSRRGRVPSRQGVTQLAHAQAAGGGARARARAPDQVDTYADLKPLTDFKRRQQPGAMSSEGA